MLLQIKLTGISGMGFVKREYPIGTKEIRLSDLQEKQKKALSLLCSYPTRASLTDLLLLS